MSTEPSRVAERVTFNLSGRTAAALERAVEIDDGNKTDSLNRAIQMYAWLRDLVESGGAVYVRSGDGAELERVRWL